MLHIAVPCIRCWACGMTLPHCCCTCRTQGAAHLPLAGQSSSVQAASTADKPTSGRQQQSIALIGAARQQQQGAPAQAPAAIAPRLDSWDLDDDGLPDGSPSLQAAGKEAEHYWVTILCAPCLQWPCVIFLHLQLLLEQSTTACGPYLDRVDTLCCFGREPLAPSTTFKTHKLQL